MGGRAWLRWVRAPALAGVLLGSGVSFHVAAGGNAPGVSILGPLFLLVVAAVAPILDSLTSPVRVTALLLGAQVVLHVALTLLAEPAATYEQGAPMSMSMGTSTPSAGGLAECLTGVSPAMVLAHVAAAALVGVWLATGERVVRTLFMLAANPTLDAWRSLRILAGTCAGRVAFPRPPSWVLCSVGEHVRLSDWAGRGLSRRGPPRSYAA